MFAVGLLSAAPAAAHPRHEDSSFQRPRKGPLAHLDPRQRAKFHEEIGFSYPFLILGGLDLIAATIVVAATPNLWQGIVGLVSGGLLVASGVAVMVHTLVDWGIGPPRKDRWSRARAPQIAFLPGVIVGRW